MNLNFSAQNHFKSLRKTEEDANQFNNDLGVTPEFQKFVAKKLTQLLDETLIEQEIHGKVRKKRKIKGGVKLLKQSEVFLDADYVENPIILPKQDRLKAKTKNDSQDEMERIREAAVEPEGILSGDDVKHWTKLYTKPHFKYKKNSTGNLVLIDE